MKRIARALARIGQLCLQAGQQLAPQLFEFLGRKARVAHRMDGELQRFGQIGACGLEGAQRARHFEPRHLVGDLLPRQPVGAAADHRLGELREHGLSRERALVTPAEVHRHVHGLAARLLRQQGEFQLADGHAPRPPVDVL
ncbi:MAG: hypothetical protein N2688_10555, partial [Burkholderiaceae bacterium]|nr:hypothetical protein [Burkholderiaceae bacterium]